jgi:outer membrane receptor protein involved in Fe transport
MSSFRLVLAAAFLAAQPAHAFDTADVDLSFGTMTGDPDPFVDNRLTGETALDFGRWGIQLGAALSHLSDADQNAARILAFRDAGAFRLGLSAARVSFDGAESDSATYGFHVLWTAPGARIDAAIIAPDHIDDTGAFSYDISGEQALGQRMTVTTDLYRLSTDLELDDFWSIALGLRYAMTDRFDLSVAGIRSTADDDNFDNSLARLGLDWHPTPETTLSATLLHLVADDDSHESGLELRLTRAIGPAADHARLFDSGPLPDRFAIGAFEP